MTQEPRAWTHWWKPGLRIWGQGMGRFGWVPGAWEPNSVQIIDNVLKEPDSEWRDTHMEWGCHCDRRANGHLREGDATKEDSSQSASEISRGRHGLCPAPPSTLCFLLPDTTNWHCAGFVFLVSWWQNRAFWLGDSEHRDQLNIFKNLKAPGVQSSKNPLVNHLADALWASFPVHAFVCLCVKSKLGSQYSLLFSLNNLCIGTNAHVHSCPSISECGVAAWGFTA